MASLPSNIASGVTYSTFEVTFTNNGPYDGLSIFTREGGSGGYTEHALAVDATSYGPVAATEGILVEYYFGVAYTGGGEATSSVYDATTVLRAPVASSATAVSGTEIQVDWTCDAGTESGFYVYYGISPAHATLGKTESADATNGTVTGLTGGNTYAFVVVAYNSYTTSADSNAVTCYLGAAYSDTLTDTVTITDSVTDAHAMVESLSDSVTITDSESDLAVISEALSDTVTITDLCLAGQTIRSDFDYYWGTSDGYVHRTAVDVLSDNGTSITSSWLSKTLDFAEIDPSNTGRWKTIYRIELVYRELDTSVTTIIKLSNDGGSTWSTKSKSLGSNGDGRMGHASYHWNKTGQFFNVKVEWASTDKEFQFLGFDVEYDDQGEQVDVV